MFGSYQFKPPFPQQRRGSWLESYLGDLQSLDGTGRGGLPTPRPQARGASLLPRMCAGPGASSVLGPMETWMLYGLH